MTHKRRNPQGVIPDWYGKPILLPNEVLVEIDRWDELGGIYRAEVDEENHLKADVFFAAATNGWIEREMNRVFDFSQHRVPWQLVGVATMANALDLLVDGWTGGKEYANQKQKNLYDCLANIQKLCMTAWETLTEDALKDFWLEDWPTVAGNMYDLSRCKFTVRHDPKNELLVQIQGDILNADFEILDRPVFEFLRDWRLGGKQWAVKAAAMVYPAQGKVRPADLFEDAWRILDDRIDLKGWDT